MEINPEPSTSWIALVMMYLEPIIAGFALVLMYLGPIIPWIALAISIRVMRINKNLQEEQQNFQKTLQREQQNFEETLQNKQLDFQKTLQEEPRHLQKTLERKQQEKTELEAAREIVTERRFQLSLSSHSLSIPRPRSLDESFKMKSYLKVTVANWKKIASLFDSDTQRDIGETLKKAMGHPSNGASSGEEFVSAWNVFLDLLTGKIFEKLRELALDIEKLKQELSLRTGISPWDL